MNLDRADDGTGRVNGVIADEPDSRPRPSPYRPPMVDEASGAVWSDLLARIDDLTEADA